MKNPLDAVRKILIDDVAVAALVAARVYPLVIPESGEIPAIVIQFISKATISLSGADCPLVNRRMQVTCIAEDYDASFEIASAADTVLKRYKGTSVGVVVQQIFRDNNVAESFSSEPEAGVDRWSYIQDYIVWYEE